MRGGVTGVAATQSIALEHAHLLAGLLEEIGGRQASHAAPDDDDIKVSGHRHTAELRHGSIIPNRLGGWLRHRLSPGLRGALVDFLPRPRADCFPPSSMRLIA